MESDKEKEIVHLKFAYNKALEILKVHNDNYIKRFQIIMVALQAGFFFTFLRLLQSSSQMPMICVMMIIVIIMGGVVASVWKKLMDKQMQYLELQKQYIRNIESRFVELGVPVDYFNVEGAIISKIPNVNFKALTVYLKSEKSEDDKKEHKFAKFKWSEQRYPRKINDKDVIHRIGNVTGGMVKAEKLLATGSLYVWIAILVLLIATKTAPPLFSLLKVICTHSPQ